MRAALLTLGYKKTHHIGRVMGSPAEVDAWKRAIDAKFFSEDKKCHSDDLDRLLGDFDVSSGLLDSLYSPPRRIQAVADVPGILFAEELIEMYPDAQVILTTRDPDRWFQSFRDTLLVMLGGRHTRVARWLDPHGFGKFVPFARLNLEILLGPLESLDQTEAKARYLAYYANIRRLVPSDRLLEYEMGEGWEKLCNFLGKDVPTGAFPHKNDAAMILAGSKRQIWAIYRTAAMKMLPPALAMIAVMSAVYARTR